MNVTTKTVLLKIYKYSLVIGLFLALSLLTFEAKSAYAAAVTWDGGASTANWSDANNWSNDAVPTANDDVTINLNTTVNIAASTTINSLTVGQNGGGTTPTLNFNYNAVTLGALIIDDGNLVVNTGATITHTVGTGSVVGKIYLRVLTGSATVSGTITANAKGYQGNSGPTPGTAAGGVNGGTGGGHGGEGAYYASAGGAASSGSITAPLEMGSGGGANCGGCGGWGGGVIQINVAGTLTVAGSIVSNGGNYASGSWAPGGGAGGSIYIITDIITGGGFITSNGGSGSSPGTGGGGGRIAIYSTTNSFNGTLTAYGGGGGNWGGAGTIYTKLASQSYGSLLLDNNNGFSSSNMDDRTLGTTPIPSITLDTLTIRNYAILTLPATATLVSGSTDWGTKGVIRDNGGTFALLSGGGNLTIPSTAILFANTPRSYSNLTVSGIITTSWNAASAVYRIQLTVSGDVSVTSTGFIRMTERGYDGNHGPTPGGWGGSNGGGGAGHGGEGGVSTFAGGGVSGSVTTPTELGSGGGANCGGCGGYGGGSIQLTIGGILNVSGSIVANGGNATTGSWGPGGGAGGSIYISALTVTGSGIIAANGGAGSGGAGGGGGRIALYYTSYSFNGTLTSYGGGSAPGGGGTIFTKTPSQNYGNLTIDNNNNFSNSNGDDRYIGSTPLSSITLDTLTVRNYGMLNVKAGVTIAYSTLVWTTKAIIKDNGGTMAGITDTGDLNIPSTSFLYANTQRTHNNVTVDGVLTTSWNWSAPTYRIDISTTGNFTISASGSIYLTERGYAGSYGPTPGVGGGCNGAGGAGHGGAGGTGSCFAGGGPSGTLAAPMELGSGGGGNWGGAGGYGGGAVKLNVSGTLSIMGNINANGGGPTTGSWAPGGGAGGSVYLIGSTISGAAAINVNGGGSAGANSGTGGGGRVHFVYQYKTYSGTVSVAGGGGARPGAVGTIANTSVPYNPSSLLQYRSDGTTIVPAAGTTNETTIIFKVAMSSGTSQPLTPQFEVRDISTSFTGTTTHTGSPVDYSGTPVIGSATVLGLADATSYKWRSRVCNSSGECSPWVSFNGPGYDFRILTNLSPHSPTLLGPSLLVNGYSINDNTPTFQFTLTDPDAGDTVSYSIQISTDNEYTNVIIDYISANDIQGARTFTVGQTLDGGSYTVGGIGQTLTDGAYYWQVKAIDDNGGESQWSTASAATPAFVLDTSNPSTNATNVTLDNATDGEWTGIEPTISWDPGTDLESDVLGYCISLSEAVIGASAPDDNPKDTAGVLNGIDDGVESTACPYIVSGETVNISSVPSLLLTSDKQYYFSIAVIDAASNVYQGDPSTFQNLVSFKYDNVLPQNVKSISAAGGVMTEISEMYFSWPTSGSSSASDAGGSGLLGYQYSLNDQATWSGTQTDALTGLSYIPLDTGLPFYLDAERDTNITVGNNIVSFRTLDIAGNISSPATYRMAALAFGGEAPTFPGNAQLVVTPETSDQNLFALSWDAAEPSEGRTVATYYYMVNTPPPATLSTMTGNSATYFATTDREVSARELPGVVKGSNVAYVVAVDDLGNYSQSAALTATFILDSENPDPPKNFTVSDGSIKEAELWRASLIWDVPDYVGAGNLTYRVQRSDDGENWTNVGSTTGNAYVDTVPESKAYFWRVGSTDPSDISIANPSWSNADTLVPKGSFTSPADLTSGPVSTLITTKRATILWTTSRTCDSRIAFGKVSGTFGKVEPSNSQHVTDHEIELTNLEPNTSYYYVAKWTDEDGNTGTSEEKYFITDPAPTIKEPTAGNVGLDTAVISFTSANASRVKIYYGISTDFGGSKVIETSSQESVYSAVLTGLQDGTKYYYKLNGFDSEGEEYEGEVHAFETMPRPRVSDVRLQQVADTAETTILVTWKSNTAISSVVTVYPTSQPNLDRDIIDLKLKAGDHSLIVSSLKPATSYTLLVKGVDKMGNQAVSNPVSFTTSIDTRPAAIINMKVIGGTIPPVGFAAGVINAQLVVTWDTDEPATSQVEYGEGTGTAYSQKTTEDGNLSTNHVVVISGLTPSQVYHLRAISNDSAGNVSRSIDTVTIAPKATKSALDLVLFNLGEIFNSLGSLGK